MSASRLFRRENGIHPLAVSYAQQRFRHKAVDSRVILFPRIIIVLDDQLRDRPRIDDRADECLACAPHLASLKEIFVRLKGDRSPFVAANAAYVPPLPFDIGVVIVDQVRVQRHQQQLQRFGKALELRDIHALQMRDADNVLEKDAFDNDDVFGAA